MVRKFKRPSEKQILDAIDCRRVKDNYLRAALHFDANKSYNDGYWDSISLPKSGDWLSEHRESLYPFSKYKKCTPLPRKQRSCLYIQPFGSFEGNAPDIERIREYAEIFFQMRTKILPHIEIITQTPTKVKIGKHYVTSRKDDDDNIQLKTGDLMNILQQSRKRDAHCVLGLTMMDLYPGDSWNYVFGEALIGDRVGVFSFYRYTPMFNNENINENSLQQMFRRAISVMAHETGHMMGIPHCVYFNCLMNGANSLEESDSQPLCVCPVCLRKLQYHLNFDTEKRYQSLYKFYKETRLEREAIWVQQRLQTIRDVSRSLNQ